MGETERGLAACIDALEERLQLVEEMGSDQLLETEKLTVKTNAMVADLAEVKQQLAQQSAHQSGEFESIRAALERLEQSSKRSAPLAPRKPAGA